MTMLHFSDPEAKAALEERKRMRDLEWLRDAIGDAAYLRSLMIDGMLEKDARVELSHLKMAKRDRWRA